MTSTCHRPGGTGQPHYRLAENLPFVQQLSTTDRDLLRFAATWLMYDGGPEGDMMVQFGLSAPRFVARLADVLRRDTESELGTGFHRRCRSVYRIDRCDAD